MRTLLSMALCLMLAGCVFDSRTMKFKFPSSGQSIDDAAVITQTLLGNSLKPLKPANVRGYASDAYSAGNYNYGNIGIEWDRRSRIGAGLRPGSDVPVAEETTRYEVEIMNGANVARTLRVFPADVNPVAWQIIATLPITASSTVTDTDASVSVAGSGLALSKQIFHVGDEDIDISFVSNTTNDTSNNNMPTVGLIPLSGLINEMFANWFPVIGFQRSGMQTIGLSSAVSLANSSSTRLLIHVHNNQAQLYQDRADDYAIPLGNESVNLPSGPYKLMVLHRAILFGGSTALALNFACTRTQSPMATYRYNDMITDFGSEQSSLTVRVYQVSGIVGRGPYSQATISLP